MKKTYYTVQTEVVNLAVENVIMGTSHTGTKTPIGTDPEEEEVFPAA